MGRPPAGTRLPSKHCSGATNAWFWDLGDVRDLTEVRLNGRDLGTLWTHPFRVDVTEIISTGANVLEVAVTNSWWNRLAGDAAGGDLTRSGAAIFEATAKVRRAGLYGPARLVAVAG
ncbi:glycosylhydrolase-like jelly roll fold domain-containing protein [Arthrobacter nitrophenolicus]|uniref:glycosylhydrolase-like jelly roll fold domain-containing protein n=1 Tax=Arthrobacter nitrophenolicus TaxID=683150 RepID=UPI0030B822DA